MSPVALLDEMIRRLEVEQTTSPGADLLRAQVIVCEVVRDAAIADRTVAESRLASRVLGGGIHSSEYVCDAGGAPSMGGRCAECVAAVSMSGPEMMEVSDG
jgi:hypothetical protein